jgi:hypothetical protein
VNSSLFRSANRFAGSQRVVRCINIQMQFLRGAHGPMAQHFTDPTWIVVKEQGSDSCARYDYTGWINRSETNGFAADTR